MGARGEGGVVGAAVPHSVRARLALDGGKGGGETFVPYCEITTRYTSPPLRVAPYTCSTDWSLSVSSLRGVLALPLTMSPQQRQERFDSGAKVYHQLARYSWSHAHQSLHGNGQDDNATPPQ